MERNTFEMKQHMLFSPLCFHADSWKSNELTDVYSVTKANM